MGLTKVNINVKLLIILLLRRELLISADLPRAIVDFTWHDGKVFDISQNKAKLSNPTSIMLKDGDDAVS